MKFKFTLLLFLQISFAFASPNASADSIFWNPTGNDLSALNLPVYAGSATVTAMVEYSGGILTAFTEDRRGHRIVFSPHGENLGDGSVAYEGRSPITSMISYQGGVLTAFSQAGGNGHRIWFSPDGRNLGGGELRYDGSSPVTAMAPYAGGVLVAFSNAGGNGHRIWFSPDGRNLGSGQLVYDGSSPVTAILPFKGGVLTAFTRAGPNGKRVHWSSNGQNLGGGQPVYDGSSPVIAMVAHDGGVLTAFTNAGPNKNRIHWSPSGENLGGGELRYDGSTIVRTMLAYKGGVIIAFGSDLAQARNKDFLEKLTTTTTTTLSGAVRRQPNGGLILVPEGQREVALPVKNPSKVLSNAIGIPVRAQVESTTDGVEVKAVTLPATAEWARVKGGLESARFPEVNSALDSLTRKVDRTLQAALPAPQAAKELLPELGRSEEQIIKAYLALKSENAEERARLISLFESVARTRKSYYGRLDVYRPLTYLRIHEVSQSAVALAEKGTGQIKCSGVLVGRNLVLTARHCLTDYFPSDELEIWFNYEEDLDGKPLTKEAFRITAVEVEGRPTPSPSSDNLDFALLRLAQNNAHQEAGDKYKWQCLSIFRLRRDDALYVVGHAQGQRRTVHDNAWVIFPFIATELDYGRMLLLVEAEFKNSDQRSLWVNMFKQSYIERNENGSKIYRQYSARFNYQPTIAAEADTFHGNSGSAAFSRISHSVIGILTAGEADEVDPWVPGWRRHEAIVPASEIIAQIKDVKPHIVDNKELCVR